VDANGDILLSTADSEILGGLSFDDGDIIAFNTLSGTATLVVAELDLFDDGDGDVTGVDALSDGALLITFEGAGEVISGDAYSAGDVVRYDPLTDTASLFFSGASFAGAGAPDVDAVDFEELVSPDVPSFVFFFSDNNNIDNQIGGLTYTDGDVVIYDSEADVATLFFAETNFDLNADVDAFHLLPDGTFLLSTLFNGRTLGGLTFNDGDLVQYDPVLDKASIFVLSEASFGGPADISAITLAPDGDLLLSTREVTSLGGVTFTDGDIVRYDIDTGTAAIVVPGTAIFDDGLGDLSSLHLLPDGTFLLSFASSTEVISGTTFNDGDIVLYDPVADTAVAVFQETQFTDGSTLHEIDALWVPSPGDCDIDGGVDFADFESAAACAAGPDLAPATGCACFDLDDDGDVDIGDLARFAPGFTG
jgi:hypothetical protein